MAISARNGETRSRGRADRSVSAVLHRRQHVGRDGARVVGVALGALVLLWLLGAEGLITSLCERGIDEDRGRYRQR